jgi:hypothetical protein
MFDSSGRPTGSLRFCGLLRGTLFKGIFPQFDEQWATWFSPCGSRKALWRASARDRNALEPKRPGRGLTCHLSWQLRMWHCCNRRELCCVKVREESVALFCWLSPRKRRWNERRIQNGRERSERSRSAARCGAVRVRSTTSAAALRVTRGHCTEVLASDQQRRWRGCRRRRHHVDPIIRRGVCRQRRCPKWRRCSPQPCSTC